MNAADHPGKDEDRENNQGGPTDCIAIERRTVEEKPGQRDKCADDRKKASEQPRRGAGTECKAVHAGKVARRPDRHNGKSDESQPAIEFARAADLETQPTPVRGGSDPLGHLSPPAWLFLLLISYAVA